MSWLSDMPEPPPLSDNAVQELIPAIETIARVTGKSPTYALNALRRYKLIHSDDIDSAHIIMDSMEPAPA